MRYYAFVICDLEGFHSVAVTIKNPKQSPTSGLVTLLGIEAYCAQIFFNKSVLRLSISPHLLQASLLLIGSYLWV
jgi:hypothetical protein